MVHVYVQLVHVGSAVATTRGHMHGDIYSPDDIHRSKIINIYTTSCQLSDSVLLYLNCYNIIYILNACVCMYIPAVHPGGR